MWVAIVNRNRRGDIVRSPPVRGETKPAALEKRLIADRASISALDDENQWKRGSFGPPWRRLVRRSPRFLLIGSRLVSSLRRALLHAWHIKLVKDSCTGIKSQEISVLEPNGHSKRVVCPTRVCSITPTSDQHLAASPFPSTIARRISRSSSGENGPLTASRKRT